MSHQLEASGIWLEFGLQKILQNIYLKCETGKITGLLARNGQGKTCLLNVMEGSLPAGYRSVQIDGIPLDTSPKPTQLRYLPQFNFIPSSLTPKRVFEDYQVAYPDFEKHFPEMASAYHKPFRDLSGGQRRIIEVYVILCSKTRFVLLDEPFSHIMPLYVEKIQELMLTEKQNKGILLTDHLYRQVMPLCDTVYVLNNGRTQLANGTDELANLGYIRFD